MRTSYGRPERGSSSGGRSVAPPRSGAAPGSGAPGGHPPQPLVPQPGWG